MCACSLAISIAALILVVSHNRETDRMRREHDGVLMPAARRATVTSRVPHRSPGPDDHDMEFVLSDGPWVVGDSGLEPYPPEVG